MNIPTPPLKPGISTSEFWAVIIGGILLTVQAGLSMMDVAWAMAGTTALGLLYTHNRAKLKSSHAQNAADLLKAQIENPPPPSA